MVHAYVCVCVDSDPVLLANDTICNNGSWVEFKCDRGKIWRLNDWTLSGGTLPDESYFISGNEKSNISTLRLRCLPRFNESYVLCINGFTSSRSCNVTLLVQGEYR